MHMPDGWSRACELSEDRLKNYTPINPISAAFCLQQTCPAARILDVDVNGVTIQYVYCQFSKCIRRYPTRKEMGLFK